MGNNSDIAPRAPVHLSEIQEMALARIREMEQEIYQNFGLKLRCGMELEWLLRNQHNAREEPSEVFDPVYYRRNTTPGAIPREGTFDRSNIVEGVTSHVSSDIHEVQLGRHANAKSRDINRMSPSVIACAAHALQHQMATWQRHPASNDRIKLWAHDPHRPNIAASTQVTLSLWGIPAEDSDKKPPVMGNLLTNDHKLLCLILDQASTTVQKALFPLIVESSDSLKRFKNGMDAPKYFGDTRYSWNPELSGCDSSLRRRSQDYDATFYLENRLPGADCDPILATLMSVGGAYLALKRSCKLAEPQKAPEENHIKILTAQQCEATLQVQRFAVPAEDKKLTAIPKELADYKKYIEGWEHNAIANEILGTDLHKKLASLRRQQFSEMAKGAAPSRL